jgi:predicted amidohydrolase YtcJ
VSGPVTLPGFHDHHVHLLSAAARLLSVDLSGERGIAGVVARLRDAAAARPAGTWIRAWGYDDAALAEDRDPNGHDLDGASRAHPIVLRHRAGHVAVLNAAAAVRVRAVAGPDAVPADGVLTDGHRALAAVPRQDAAALDRAVAALSAQLAAAGVTAVTDATATNDRSALARLGALVRGGALRQRVQAMVGAHHVEELAAAGIAYGDVLDGVRVVHAKHELRPGDDPAAVVALVARCAAVGYPVALHVLDLVEADVALAALEAVPPPPGTRHRVEHLALSLPEHVARLARLPVVVVSNPGFLAARGAKYRARLSEDERGWLYRIGSLVAAGVPVRAGSDAPVTDSDPLAAMAAAVDRTLAPGERISPAQALALFAPDPAVAAFGDRVVLSGDGGAVLQTSITNTIDNRRTAA